MASFHERGIRFGQQPGDPIPFPDGALSSSADGGPDIHPASIDARNSYIYEKETFTETASSLSPTVQAQLAERARRRVFDGETRLFRLPRSRNRPVIESTARISSRRQP